MSWRAQCAILLLVCSAAAAGLDGRWAVEVTPQTSKGTQGNSYGTILDLRTNGSQLTGSVIPMQGKTAHSIPIVGGTIDGDHFVFSTLQSSKKGDSTMAEWEGTVSGDQITGQRTSNGTRRSRAVFKGKRQN